MTLITDGENAFPRVEFSILGVYHTRFRRLQQQRASQCGRIVL